MDFEPARIERHGKLHIPKHFRAAFGWKAGTDVVIVREGDGLRVLSPQAAIDLGRVQAAAPVSSGPPPSQEPRG